MNDILNELDKIGAETKDALGSFMNDKEMYLKYVLGFPEEPSMGRLRKAVDDQDYDTAKKEIHAIKGIVSNLRFVPLTDAAIDMLEELRDNNIEEALDAYEDVKKQYQIFCEVIQKNR